ncbi:MAG: 50S ribosomal protein L11 methyltransferase [Negativicutes bacterium]|nr:50S ribosomal protein L11 methyltransferase [Negativicutes bacterium]
MKWAEVCIHTSHEATEAVADIFHDLGAAGVVIEDPELINSYRRSGTWEYCDIPEETDIETVIVKAYLPVDAELDDKLKEFEQRINRLISYNINKGKGHISWREVQEEDWATSWKTYFHPIPVGERIVIKPSWEAYDAAPGEIVIELDPGMAFGTGTHHTTAMCIRCLEETIKGGETVFDVGAGSGILALAAAKLGAASVWAADLDAVAVRVAAENIALNQAADVVKVVQGDLLTGAPGRADIIVANIIADVIIKMLPDVPAKLKLGGVFIGSGIIAERLADVTAACLAQDLFVEKVMEEGGWAAIVARRGGN